MRVSISGCRSPGFAFRSALVTHDHAELAAIDAVRLDRVGAGGGPCGQSQSRMARGAAGQQRWRRAGLYARGAASAGGMSIIALQATGGGASRIVPRLAAPSVSGDLADVIVTEHGVARLKGLSARGRAEALIAIAAPEHRAFLARG